MRKRLAEILCWCALAGGVWGSVLLRNGAPALTEDSYQYLSVADNLVERRAITTSIIHFDTERSHGVVPAPLTTFPFGYPALIAALGLLGIPPLTAGWLVSFVSFVLLVPLLWIAGLALALDRWIIRALSLLLIANSQIAAMATRLATEPLFTLLSAAALLLLAAASRAERRTLPPPALLAGLALAGATYYVRYAGLFLIAAVGLYYAFRLVRERNAPALGRALALTLPAILVAAGMLRNWALTGSWKGGNEKIVHNPVAATLVEFVKSLYRVVFGEAARARVSPAEAAVVIGLGLVVAVLVWRWRALPKGLDVSPLVRPALALLCVYLAVYCAGMCYLGISSAISFGSRMFVPLLPALLVLFGLALNSGLAAGGNRRALLAGLALLSAGYVAMHARHLLVEPRPAPHQVALAALEPLTRWIENRIPRDAVLVAANGQGAAYALHRKTISLVGSQYSDVAWDDPHVRRLMERYRADYLILFPGIDPDLAPEQQAPFFQSLLHGGAPSWLVLEAASPRVRVYRRLATR